MKRSLVLVLGLLTGMAFATDMVKSTVPTLSDAEKLQLREFELKDSQFSNQLTGIQQQQKQNAEAFGKWAADKCKGTDGKQYQIDMNTATCVAAAPEKK